MGRVEVSARGSFPPERFVAALTDFGAERSRIWGNSTPGLFEVHDLREHSADVTEGTRHGGVWQRYHCDWAKPGLVRLDVVDSNTFGPGSYWEYRVTAALRGMLRRSQSWPLPGAPTGERSPSNRGKCRWRCRAAVTRLEKSRR